MFRKYVLETNSGELLPSRDSFKFANYGHTISGWRCPTKRPVYRAIYQVFSLLQTLIAIYLPIGMAFSYIREFKSFTPGELITSVQVCFNVPSCLFKAGTLYFSLWRLDQAKEMLDALDKSCVRTKEKVQIHRSVLQCNLIFCVYFIVYNMYVFTGFAAAVLIGVSPWNIYIPLLNWRNGNWEYWTSAIIEFVLVLIVVYYNNAADIYPSIFGLTVRSHIDLLRQRIQHLRRDTTKNEANNYDELKGCIKDHKQIILYCNLMRPLISRTIFTQFIVVGILFGLCLTNLFFFVDLGSGIATAVYIFGCMCQTFPFCYICNSLNDDVNNLTLAIFQSNWQDASPRYKSTLVYFLHNAQQPIQFTAGSILPISVSSNIGLAKFAFSVVTIVQQFNLDEKLKNN